MCTPASQYRGQCVFLFITIRTPRLEPAELTIIANVLVHRSVTCKVVVNPMKVYLQISIPCDINGHSLFSRFRQGLINPLDLKT